MKKMSIVSRIPDAPTEINTGSMEAFSDETEMQMMSLEEDQRDEGDRRG